MKERESGRVGHHAMGSRKPVCIDGRNESKTNHFCLFSLPSLPPTAPPPPQQIVGHPLRRLGWDRSARDKRSDFSTQCGGDYVQGRCGDGHGDHHAGFGRGRIHL